MFSPSLGRGARMGYPAMGVGPVQRGQRRTGWALLVPVVMRPKRASCQAILGFADLIMVC